MNWPFRGKSYGSVAEAVRAGDVKGLQIMLERGEDPNSYDAEYGAYAIHHAVGRLSWETVDYRKTVDIIKLLVAHGADVNIALKGTTPLWIAEAGRHTEVAAILRAAGAHLHLERGVVNRSPNGDKNAVSNRPKTSLHPAKEKEIERIARDFAHQIKMIEPDLTAEEMVEIIEDKIIVAPDPGTPMDAYPKFKEEMRTIIHAEVAKLF